MFNHAFWKAFWSWMTLTLLQCFAFASEFVLDQFVASTKPCEIGQLAWKNEPKPLEPATRLPHHQPCKFGSNRVRREWALLSTRTHHGFPPSKTVVDTPRGRRDHRVMPQAGGPLGATVQRFTGIVPKPWRAYGRPPDLERIAALTWTTYPSMLRRSFLATFPTLLHLPSRVPPPTKLPLQATFLAGNTAKIYWWTSSTSNMPVNSPFIWIMSWESLVMVLVSGASPLQGAPSTAGREKRQAIYTRVGCTLTTSLVPCPSWEGDIKCDDVISRSPFSAIWSQMAVWNL